MENYQESLNKIKEILKENDQGLSIGDISKRIKVNRNAVAKYLDVLQISGFIELRKVGPTKLFYLTTRVPTNALLDSSDELIIILDNNMNINQMNKKAKEKLKSKAKKISDLISDELFLSSLKKRKPCEINLNEKTIQFKFIDCTFEDGTKGITIVGEDITKSKFAQEELLVLKKAIESSSSGITIADATKKDFPLIYVNPGFEKITGYKEKDILGKNCRFLQGKDTNQPGLDIVRKALKEKKDCVVEIKNYKKNGNLFWNELRLSPVKNSKGEVTHYVGIQTDITHKKK